MDDLLGGSLGMLWREIGHFSHQEYPFLAPEYSPNSRMPCSDFTPFMVDRLKGGDIAPIKSLMGFIAGSGLVTSKRWMDDIIDGINDIRLDRYFYADNPNAYHEIKALFILAAKSGGDPRFLQTEDGVLEIIAMAIACFNIVATDHLSELAVLGNRFIKKKRLDVSSGYWENVPLFPISTIQIKGVETSDMLQKFRSLPIGCRVGLIASYRTGRFDSFSVRSFGFMASHIIRSTMDMGFIKPVVSSGALQKLCSKDELLEYCQKHGVTVRKTWTKSVISELFCRERHEECRQICTDRLSFAVADELSETLNGMLARLPALMALLKLSLFAIPSGK